jgi:CRISPR system Cascade subunit CasE
MFLNRIHLDLRSKEARRDLSDPYQLHSTICRAFSTPERKCHEGEFLWRLEPETDAAGCPHILVQSKTVPKWTDIGVKRWLADADPAINIADRLKLDRLKNGQRYRFRLRANPCVTRNGKRLGLLNLEEQETWIARKGQQHGFSLPQLVSIDRLDSSQSRIDVQISQEQMLRGNRHSGNIILVFSVLYDGILIVTEPNRFREALGTGVGHGKVMGLGLLSVVPVA